jgi:hypothetical protein
MPKPPSVHSPKPTHFTLSHKLAIVSILVTIVVGTASIVVTVIVPEIRQILFPPAISSVPGPNYYVPNPDHRSGSDNDVPLSDKVPGAK